MNMLLGLASVLVLGTPAASPDTLSFRFIGNMAYAITDGTTTLYTDFPYQSGYSDYMTYDFEAVPKAPGSLCLITHGHLDHFDPSLFPRMDCALIAPASVVARLKTDRAIPLAREMTYRDIRIEPLATPHGPMEHYSYLVTWHGLRLYFTGDTDSTERLLATKNLDAAFVSPWLLEAVAKRSARIDAKQVIVCHQTSAETVPDNQKRRLPKQGETFTLEGVSAAGVPR
jgi:L-ascorbate metabolism protein UlaG (beta-lactamase superfamily)